MQIDLLYFAACPHLGAARTQLRRALALSNLPTEWTEHDVTAPTTPPGLRGYGSPTILVDGVDVLGAPPGEASACRLYLDTDTPGAPPLKALLAALSPASPTPSR